jgi:hypothetical protein
LGSRSFSVGTDARASGESFRPSSSSRWPARPDLDCARDLLFAEHLPGLGILAEVDEIGAAGFDFEFVVTYWPARHRLNGASLIQ